MLNQFQADVVLRIDLAIQLGIGLQDFFARREDLVQFGRPLARSLLREAALDQFQHDRHGHRSTWRRAQQGGQRAVFGCNQLGAKLQHAALIVGLGDSIAEHFQQERYRDLLQVDPVRLIEAVVACVGFVAAGTILRGSRDDQVSGLTTASSLIMSASIGIAVGIGEYVIAIGVSILCLIVLAVFSRIAKKIEPHD